MKAALLNKLLLALSFVGIFIAGSLSYSHHSGSALECGKSSGCQEVALYVSKNWSNFPVADVGLAAYVVLALLALFRLLKGFEPKQQLPTVALTVVGALASVGLTVFAFTAIKATCLYCVASMIVMILMAATALMLWTGDAERVPGQSGLGSWGLAGACGVAALIGIAFATNDASGPPSGLSNVPDKVELMIPEKAHAIGESTAEVVAIEFYDLFCGHCRETYQEAKSKVRDSGGKLQIVFRHFPIPQLQGHEHTELAMNLAEIAAEKGKYFTFVDALFQLDRATTTPSQMMGIMKSLGFTEKEVVDRVGKETDSAFMKFYADKTYADKLGLDTTPTFFIARRGERPGMFKRSTHEAELRRLGAIQ